MLVLEVQAYRQLQGRRDPQTRTQRSKEKQKNIDQDEIGPANFGITTPISPTGFWNE